MKVFKSALFDADKKIVTPAEGRSGMWTIRFERRPFYDYFRKPQRNKKV